MGVLTLLTSLAQQLPASAQLLDCLPSSERAAVWHVANPVRRATAAGPMLRCSHCSMPLLHSLLLGRPAAGVRPNLPWVCRSGFGCAGCCSSMEQLAHLRCWVYVLITAPGSADRPSLGQGCQSPALRSALASSQLTRASATGTPQLPMPRNPATL